MYCFVAVRIVLLFDSSSKGNHCSICITKLQVFTLLTAKCEPTLQRRRIVAFPLQQWLHDRVTMLGTRTLPTL
jgi:hypothetical protein